MYLSIEICRTYIGATAYFFSVTLVYNFNISKLNNTLNSIHFYVITLKDMLSTIVYINI